MSKVSQDEIAKLVSESRPSIKKWMENPELMPVGVYKKLEALGINLHTQEWQVVACELCEGRGFRLATPAPKDSSEIEEDKNG